MSDIEKFFFHELPGNVRFRLFRNEDIATVVTVYRDEDGIIENVTRMKVSQFKRLRDNARKRLGIRSYNLLTSRFGFNDQVEKAPPVPLKMLATGTK